jgi:fimbrial chaperone protein
MKKFMLISSLLAFSSLSWAFRLDPMVTEFSPSGPEQSKVFRIENNGQERIAVQLKMTTRKIDSRGQESREAVSDFSIYPEQMSLGPNDARNVRVTYQGAKEIEVEKAYRLIAAQLPVEFKSAAQKKSQLNFLFEYVASIYVRPEGTQAKLEIQKVEPLNENKIHLILENKGSAHRLLKGVTVAVTTEAGKNISLQPQSDQAWESENLLAGMTREFDLQTTDKIPAKATLKASLKISDQP